MQTIVSKWLVKVDVRNGREKHRLIEDNEEKKMRNRLKNGGESRSESC